MIQFKRGKTATWYKQKTPLASGQPGYDKDKNKIKIGDGKSSWSELPSASGLSAEEILSSEADAKKRRKTLLDILVNPVAALLKKESPAVITYGTEAPDKDTVGQIYLQHYDAEPEVDYIVKAGNSGIWTYQLWKSGIAKCYGTLKVTTPLHTANEKNLLYSDNKVVESIKYPEHFKFTEAPNETATIHSEGDNIVWLASRGSNTQSTTAKYTIMSMDRWNSITYKINLKVEGRWK